MYLNEYNLEQALKALKKLKKQGYNASYDTETSNIVIDIDSVLDLSAEVSNTESVDSNDTKESSKLEQSLPNNLITLGERISQRKLRSYFKRNDLKRAGSLARDMYKNTYGKVPDKNSKKTLVYPKAALEILDEAINMTIEKMSSNEKR